MLGAHVFHFGFDVDVFFAGKTNNNKINWNTVIRFDHAFSFGFTTGRFESKDTFCCCLFSIMFCLFCCCLLLLNEINVV